MYRKYSLALLFLALLSATSHCQTLQKDEEVIIFPSYAYEGGHGKVKLNVHAWIFESEPDSLWRRSLVQSVKKYFPAPQSAEEQKILTKRLHGFTPDNERNKKLALQLGTRALNPGLTESDGHVQAELELSLSPTERGALEKGAYPLTWERGGHQQPLWIASQGVSVVSDIDDTIKITQVLDRQAMIANTFLKEFQVVPGMPELYQRLARKASVFHYVSASPWQLYPDLNAFLQSHFPAGTVSLRKLRWKDSSAVDFLWKDSQDYKIATIAEFMERFPQRTFILIGDSGEKDPDVYDAIRRRFPLRVIGILIRIPPEQKDVPRKEGMDYFRDPAELEAVLKRWKL